MIASIQRRIVTSNTHQLPIDMPALLQRIYLARGISTSEELDLNMKHLLPYHDFKDMDKAVALLIDAIVRQRKILIVGDFDVDGATSTALAVQALTKMGAQHVDYLVPNRFEFGYGLTPEIVEVAKQKKNPDLIITVDNGISSVDGIAVARAAGIDVLVTDHHLPGDETPNANAIVNPNQKNCKFESKAACGCAVIFYVMAGLRAGLKKQQWFEQQQIKEPNLAEFLDLVALATVADVVPLDKNNRILVQHGLQRIRTGKSRPGILALFDVANKQPHRLIASDLGFAIGPRINAAGRLDDMGVGIECLLTNNPQLAKDYAQVLDDLNVDRKQIEAQMQHEALISLRSLDIDERSLPHALCIFNKEWHQGVIGILASRIKERYNRPVIAFAPADNGEIKGSARSIPGLHMRDALDEVAKKAPHILKKFGGHAMAAGLSIYEKDYPQFSVLLEEIVKKRLSDDDLKSVLLTDGELQSSDFNMFFAQQLRHAGPWGQQFPEPLFLYRAHEDRTKYAIGNPRM